MKTARERAEIMLDAIELYKGVRRELTIDAIERALKEVSRDTRHACADNTDLLFSAIDLSCNRAQVTASEVHNAIMNTKSV